VNFPLSTYSVFAKKNVSQEHKNIWTESRSTAVCPHIRTNPRPLGPLLVVLQRFAQLVFTCSLSFHPAAKWKLPWTQGNLRRVKSAA
jgi:hypothetical protein